MRPFFDLISCPGSSCALMFEIKGKLATVKAARYTVGAHGCGAAAAHA